MDLWINKIWELNEFQRDIPYHWKQKVVNFSVLHKAAGSYFDHSIINLTFSPLIEPHKPLCDGNPSKDTSSFYLWLQMAHSLGYN